MVVRSTDKINWGATGQERVAQNVRNLMNTFRYEIAYDRTLGLPREAVDKPGPQAAAILQVELAQLIARYEPRARVSDITCGFAADGSLIMEVVLE